jgi:hypothetical protein
MAGREESKPWKGMENTLLGKLVDLVRENICGVMNSQNGIFISPEVLTWQS